MIESARPAIPHDAYLLPLRARSKKPASTHAHFDAVPQAQFVVLGNYGIRLTGQFIVIDFDAQDPYRDRIETQLPPTWQQQTPGGMHYLFRAPAGWQGQNRDLVVGTGAQRRKIGDVKCNGYIVGPGSSVDADRGRPAGHYALVRGIDPAPAPEWLLDFAKVSDKLPQINGAEQAPERARIAIGENDVELHKLGSYFRHRGFDKDFIKAALVAVVDAGLMEQVPGNEYQEADFERLARATSKYAPGSPDELQVTPAAWQTVEELPRVGDAPVEWIIDDYIPQGALVMLYGPGGVGKSTFASWIAARVTARGKLFGFVPAGEETAEMFAAKVKAAGGDVAHLRCLKPGTQLRFPRDAQALRDSIEVMGLACIYFDAYRSHMQRSEGANEADRTRDALQPLSEVAVATKCTVLCTTHQTKYSEEMLGSVEAENVSRAVLRVFAPKKAPKGRVCVVVKKANFKQPEGAIVYEIGSTDFADALTGRKAMERRENGEMRPLTIGFVKTCEMNAVLLDELEAPTKQAEIEGLPGG